MKAYLLLALANFKTLCVFAAGLFFSWVTWGWAITAFTESEPTRISAKDFASNYRGQYWLAVEGHIAVEQRHIRKVNNEVAFVFVPIVPADWKPTDPVHVIARFGPMATNYTQGWSAAYSSSQPAVVQGMNLWTDGVSIDNETAFPKLRFESPVAVVRQGEAPMGTTKAGSMFALMLTILALATWRLSRSIRRLINDKRAASGTSGR
jgi:hypothetical protein